MSDNDHHPEMSRVERPGWIDAALSFELEGIAAASEGISVEFKAEMPTQASNIAKEMAAFATTGTGRIFIGISDDGEIIGLPDLATHEARLALRNRIEGLAASVKPVIYPALSFAVVGTGESQKIVAVITVPKGEAPIYYAGSIGYVRQMSMSRPLSPDEVIDRVRSWDKTSKPTAESRFLSDLASLLLEIDVMLLDFRARSPRRGLSELKSEAGHFSSLARKVSASAPQSLVETEPLLESLSDALVTIASTRSAIGTPRIELLCAIDEVEQSVRQMRARWVPPEKFGEATAQDAREKVRTATKHLANLAGRLTEHRAGVRLTDVTAEVAERGLEILRCASLGVGLGDEERVADLLDQAVALRSFELRQTYHDGGESRRQLIDDISAANERLQIWIAELR